MQATLVAVRHDLRRDFYAARLLPERKRKIYVNQKKERRPTASQQAAGDEKRRPARTQARM
jgi:hypothetical protein